MDHLGKRSKDAILPVQIAYFTGLRLGEVAGLSWQDINLDEQYLTVRRSVRYNNARHKTEIGPTKRKKVRVVDFGDTLADIYGQPKKNSTSNAFSMGSCITGIIGTFRCQYHHECLRSRNKGKYIEVHIDRL